MTKTEVCEALERAAATVKESGLLAFVRGYGDVQSRRNQDAALLCTLRERIERGEECDNVFEEKRNLLIIDWSDEGEAG